MSMTRPTTEQITHEGQLLSGVLRAFVTPSAFGAVGDGVADDTLALRAAFDYAIPLKRTVLLRGNYRVTGYIQDSVTRSSGELHIVCDGNVTITVDPASAVFEYLIACVVTSPTNMSITGGSLVIDGSLRVANAIYCRNLAPSVNGIANIDSPLTVSNCRLHRTTGANLFAQAISVFGQWQTVAIESPTVIQVERAGAGSCKGIYVDVGDDGHCSIRNAYVKNILHGTTTVDADGLHVQGYLPPGFTNSTYASGTFIIDSCTFVDCQVRSLKIQASNCTVISPSIFRQMLVSPTVATDIDFQWGNGTLIAPTYEFRLNGSTSPLGASYIGVFFSHHLDSGASSAVCRDMKVISDHAMPARMFSISTLPNAQSHTTVIDGVEFVPANGYAGIISPFVVQLARVEPEWRDMAGTGFVTVRNVSGPLSGNIIRADNYSGGAIADKIAIEITNVKNTYYGAAPLSVFRGFNTRIAKLDKFMLRDNENVNDMMWTQGNALSDFDFATLQVGNRFSVAMEYMGTVLNPPPWETGSGRRALIEVLSCGPAVINTGKIIRVTTFGGASTDRPKVFISVDNATTWTELNACPPSVKTADFTVLPTEDVLVNNKTGSACIATLPAAATYKGRKILIKTIQAQAVNSASSNVVPLAGGAAGTAIVTGTAGKWAELVSDGTNWVIMAGN